jgi:hypothetical protein
MKAPGKWLIFKPNSLFLEVADTIIHLALAQNLLRASENHFTLSEIYEG